MEFGPGGSCGRFETGVLHGILIPFRWAEWFLPGEPFLKKCPNMEKINFFRNMHVQQIQKFQFFIKKKRQRPNVECSRKLLRILGYICTGIYIYIYIHLQKKKLVSYEFTFFTEISNIKFSQNSFFGNDFPYNVFFC